MDGYRISEAARASGFSVSALRFYEQEGVVVPERTATGYRSYRDDHVDALRFVARGKQLGLSLDDITELLALLDREECTPLQERIRHLLHERLGQAQDQIAALTSFTIQLRQTAARLDVHTPDGACDEECGCTSNGGWPTATDQAKLTPLVGIVSGDIACALDPSSVGDRIEEWNRTLVAATARLRIEHGLRVVFDRDVDVAALVELAAAEQTCCTFFEFRIGIGSDGVSLEVTGPDDAQDVIAAVFGGAA